MTDTPPVMDPLKIAEFSGGTWSADRICCLGETTSTNDKALELIYNRGASADRTAITAEEQSTGRGRFGRKWISKRGLGLALSIAISTPPDTQPESLSLLPLAGAIAVIRAIETTTGKNARLKWPNDILLNERKIAGTIAEVKWRMNQPVGAALGAGVNIYHKPEDFPNELVLSATSIYMETGEMVVKEKFTGALLSMLNQLLDLTLQNRSRIISIASTLWVHQPDDPIEIVSSDQRISGSFKGIAEDGALILKTDKGPLTVRYGDAGNLRRLR